MTGIPCTCPSGNRTLRWPCPTHPRRIVSEAGAPTISPMPNKPATTLRNFRIPDEEYIAAQDKAASAGTNLTAVVRELLRNWVANNDGVSQSETGTATD